jgi:mono/diheme cytochrome c family protein
MMMDGLASQPVRKRSTVWLFRWGLLGLLLVLWQPGTDGQAAPRLTGATRPAGRTDPTRFAGALFQTRCVRCHETDGTARDLRAAIPEIPDFTNPRWHQQHDTHQLVVSILEGKGSRMPPFGDKITREQAMDLVAYIRSLGPLPSSAPTVEDDFDERFRELQEEYEHLRMQLDEIARRHRRMPRRAFPR